MNADGIHWKRAYEARGDEIDKLRDILTRAVDWLDGDTSEPWMRDAQATVALSLKDEAR